MGPWPSERNSQACHGAHDPFSLVYSISPFGKTPLARPKTTGFLEE